MGVGKGATLAAALKLGPYNTGAIFRVPIHQGAVVPGTESKQRSACSVPEAVEEVLDYALPSDITLITVERGGTSKQPELDIEVTRRPPPVAYALLGVSILCASCYDLSMQLLVRT
jgi:hypothetical protein